MLREFKDFIMRGNVVDLAIAVIIGGAFGTIVKSLIDDIIMPIVGIIIGGVDFTSLAIMVGKAELKYGNFIQTLINFLIIAWILFLIIKAMNRASGKKKEAPAAPREDVKLLTEIRDLLKKR